MTSLRRVVVFGGTSQIARECLHIWAERGLHAVLVGRDRAALEAVAADVTGRRPGNGADVVVGDFTSGSSIEMLVDEAFKYGPADVVMVAVGSLPKQPEVLSDPDRMLAELTLNGAVAALLCELAGQRLREQGRGHLVVLGSLASARGRRSNYVYGAGKAMLETYVEGLRHSLAGTDVRVTVVKPGPTATRMTEDLPARARRAPVDVVARAVVSGVDQERAVIYTPRKWRAVVTLLRMMPRPVYDRLDI